MLGLFGINSALRSNLPELELNQKLERSGMNRFKNLYCRGGAVKTLLHGSTWKIITALPVMCHANIHSSESEAGEKALENERWSLAIWINYVLQQ